MDDNTFTIKQASKILHCSAQNIYQQKSKLMKLGFMEKSTTGSYYLKKDGINYLQEKRSETQKVNSQLFNQVDDKNSIGFTNYNVQTNNIELINILKEQVQELKAEKNFWQSKYMEKDIQLDSKNEYIQQLNMQIFEILKSSEQNKQQKQNFKKGFFKKIFN